MSDFKLCGEHYIKRIKTAGLPVIIYGMGNGADKVIDLFEKNGIKIAGVTASDDFVRGQTFRGFKVKRLSEFDGEFIIAPSFGTCISSVMQHIIDLSKLFNVIYPSVPVIGEETADDIFFERNYDKINKAYSLFSERSKKIFTGCMNFIYTGDLSYLLDITTEKSEIFTDFLKPDGSGTYIDIGAYRGETVEEYLKYTSGKYERIIAAEPDPKSFKKLKERFGEYSGIILTDRVCSDKAKTVYFDSLSGRQSHISGSGKPAQTFSIDEIACEYDVSYIKIDAEGSEIEILKGAENTIKRCKPRLNTALYHRFRDYCEIPLQIMEYRDDYEFEIRHHPYFPCWDTNLYCR